MHDYRLYYELFTEYFIAHRTSHLPSCTVICVSSCSSTNFKPISITSYTSPLDAGQYAVAAARTRHCNGDVIALSNAMMKNRTHLDLSLRSRLVGLLSRPLETRFAPFVQEYISMATLVCAHVTAILGLVNL